LDATNRRITKITQKTGQASVAKVLLKRTNRDALQNTALGGLLATYRLIGTWPPIGVGART
jgi:hypothetical protein